MSDIVWIKKKQVCFAWLLGLGGILIYIFILSDTVGSNTVNIDIQ